MKLIKATSRNKIKEIKNTTEVITFEPKTLKKAGNYIISNLRLLIIGIFISFVDLSIEITLKGGGVKQIDIFNDLVGLVLIIIAITRLQKLPASRRFCLSMDFVRYLTFFLITTAFIDLFIKVGDTFQEFITNSTDLVEAAALILFSYSMKLLSNELNLLDLGKQWTKALYLFWIYGIIILIVTLCSFLLIPENVETPLFGLQIIGYSLTFLLIIFIIAFVITIYITYKMKVTIQSMTISTFDST